MSSKHWHETRLLEPPDCTVSGRFGGSVMFVAFDRLTKQWVWLQPNSVVEKIPEPTHIFVDDDYVNNHTLATPRPARERSHLIRKKRSQQLLLDV